MAYHTKTKSVLNPGIGDIYYKEAVMPGQIFMMIQPNYLKMNPMQIAVKNTTVTTEQGIISTPKHFAKRVLLLLDRTYIMARSQIIWFPSLIVNFLSPTKFSI